MNMDKKEVSGEEYKAMLINNNKNKSSSNNKLIISIIVVVVLCGLSFYGGMAYQKNKKSSSSTSSSSSGSGSGFGGGRGFNRADIVLGQVTAISPTSISVNNTRTGSTSTLAVTSSTTVTNNGQSDTVSDIQVGDTVLVRENTSNTSQAASILVNPSFGGGAGGSGGSGSSTSAPSSSI